MKKIVLPLLLASLFLAVTASAKIRRVGFFANQIANQDYPLFVDAYNSASSGDTILVFPGKSIPNGFGITKKLVIIGTGNWLDPNSTPKGNANLQAFAGTPTSGSVYFQTGSAGSVIMGFDFGSTTVYVSADDITIRRNKDIYVNLAYNINGPANTPLAVNNLQILENYRLGITDSYNDFPNQTLNISNNLMIYFNLTHTGPYKGSVFNNIWALDGSGAINGGSGSFSSAQSIVLGGGVWLFQNNILLSYTNASAASNYNYFTFTGETNSVFNYNLNVQSYNGSTWPVGSGNITVTPANAALVFNGFPAIGSFTADNRYQLTANSAAKVANRPGSSVDAGMFAGPTPYKLSTIPSIPTIYLFTSPQGNNPTGSTIQFNVSTRANN